MVGTKQINVEVRRKIQNGVPVQNNRRVSAWMVEDQQRCYRDNRGSLLSNISSRMESMYGKNQYVFETIDGNTLKVWTVRFDGMKFNVYSGKGGSYYEMLNINLDAVRNMNDVDTDRVIKFLSHISNGK